MNRYAVIGLLAAVGLAPLSTGCQLLRDDSKDNYRAYMVKNSKDRFDTTATGAPKPDAEKTGLLTAGATTPPANLPPVMSIPVPPAAPPPVTVAPVTVAPASPPVTVAPVPLPPTLALGNPHQLPRPTATGAILNLAPGESAMDRAADLIRRADEATTENKVLQARVRSLEAKALEREQAIAESLRDVDAAAVEVTKARAEIAGLRKDIQALKLRVQQVEADEMETLKLIIEALEKLLKAPEGKK